MSREFESQVGMISEQLEAWHNYGKDQVKLRVQDLLEKLTSARSIPKRGRIIKGSMETPSLPSNTGKVVMSAHIVFNTSSRSDTVEIALQFKDSSLNVAVVEGKRKEHIHICGSREHNHEFLFASRDGFPGTGGLTNFKTAMEVLELVEQISPKTPIKAK